LQRASRKANRKNWMKTPESPRRRPLPPENDRQPCLLNGNTMSHPEIPTFTRSTSDRQACAARAAYVNGKRLHHGL
jgi:hypothetical protein